MSAVGKFIGRWFWTWIWSAIAGINIGSAVVYGERGDLAMAVIDAAWAIVFVALVVWDYRRNLRK